MSSRILAEVSEAIVAGRDVEPAVVHAIGRSLEPACVERAALFLVNPGAPPRWTAIKGQSAAWPRIDALVRAHGQASSVLLDRARAPDAGELLDAFGAEALLLVPLLRAGAPIGAVVVSPGPSGTFDAAARELLEGAAPSVALAVALGKTLARGSSAEWQALVEQSPDLILLVDAQGTVRFLNRPSPRFPALCVGRTWPHYSTGETADRIRDALARAFATGEHSSLDATVQAPDGAAASFELNIGPIRREGQIVNAVVIARDVTLKKQTESQLLIADRLVTVGTLASGVAHEINNPLATVIANLDLAQGEVSALPPEHLSPDLRDELADAREAAERVRLIVRDLRMFSRPEEERRGPIDLRSVLEGTLRMAWHEIRHRARLVKLLDRVPPVEGNESRLGQVFLNLVMNAAQSIPEGHAAENEIRVTLRMDDAGRVVAEVTDTGCGMSAEAQTRIFTPFFTTKERAMGTGLGLTISQRIVTALGGELRFSSREGVGSTFTVILPALTEERQDQAATKSGPIPVAGRLLIVDDDPSVSKALERALREQGSIDVLHQGADVVARMTAGERWDVILCDLMMPQMSGMELHEAVRRIDADQASRMVFITGGAFTARGREFLDRVPNPCLEKPFDPVALRKLVRDILRGRR